MEGDLASEPYLGDELDVTRDGRQSQQAEEMPLGHWSFVLFNELDWIWGAEDLLRLMGSLEDLGPGVFYLLHGICFLHEEFLLS